MMTPYPDSTFRNGHLPVPSTAGESSPDHGKQLYALFEAALRLSPEDHPKFLEHQCPNNPALRAEVEKLLRHDAAAEKEGFLAEVLAGTIVPRRPPSLAEQSLTEKRIGPYKVLERVASGGM